MRTFFSFIASASHPKWKLTIGSDINDAGVIVGSAMKGGVEHGFMLVPKFCPLPRGR